jgi:hypothetical protein
MTNKRTLILLMYFYCNFFTNMFRSVGFWLENLRERDHWGDPDVDGRIMLRWIFGKWEGAVGTGWSWLRIGTGVGTCEYGEEPSGSKTVGIFLTSCRTS